MRAAHRHEYREDKTLRHVFMEEVAHRIHKDAARFLPVKRLVEALGVCTNVREFTLPEFTGSRRVWISVRDASRRIDRNALTVSRSRKHPFRVAVCAAGG